MLEKLYPFSRNYFDCDGVRMHYVDEGEGPVIVCVHGNPTWSFLWRDIIARYSASHRVIALDHIGCGFSEKPKEYPYTLEQHIKNLTLLIKHLGLERFTLMVHDWGGAIGCGYAVQHPEHIERLVISNTAAFRESKVPLRIRLAQLPLFGRFAVTRLNAFVLGLVHMARETTLSKEVREGFLAPYDSVASREALYQFVKDIPSYETHPSYKTLCEIESGLQNLRDIPGILLWGNKDWVFHPGFARRWKELLPQLQEYPLEHAGHLLFEDAPDEVFAVLDDFFTPPKMGVASW